MTAPLFLTISISPKPILEAIRESLVFGKEHWRKWLLPTFILYLISGALTFSALGIRPQTLFIWWNLFFELNVSDNYLQQFKWIWIWGSSGFSEAHTVFIKTFSDTQQAERLFLITSFGMSLLNTLVQLKIVEKCYSVINKDLLDKK